jgi:hypothetical protein
VSKTGVRKLAKTKIFATKVKKAAPKKLTTEEIVNALLKKAMGQVDQGVVDTLDQAISEAR